MKKWLKKASIILPIVFVLALFVLAHPALAADEPTLKSVIFGSGSFFGWMFFKIAYIISYIGGIGVTVLAWACGIILRMSTGAVNTAAVQGGYNVTLALANMGFIIGIIIVAIATIIRNQTYGIKNLLTKVVIMAVLVNFGLVLAGSLINISNSLATYFMDATTGGKGPDGFASMMASSFAPQKLFSPTTKSDTLDPELAKTMAGSGDSMTGLLQPLAGLLMAIIGTVMIIITLAAFLVMLIIRYVYLVILLILLPLAWMSWAFPGQINHFGKWWSKFIQQILFPPVALFFIWVALKTSQALFSSDPGIIGQGATVAASMGKFIQGMIVPLMDIVVLSFMMAGGLMAAQELGAAGASMGMKWAGSTKDWALKRAGRVTKRGLSRGFQAEGVQKAAGAAMKSTRGGPLGYLTRLTGRGLAAAARPGGANQVAEYEAQYGKLSKAQLLEEFRADPLGHNKNSRAALLNLLQKQNALGSLTPDELKKHVSGPENQEVFRQIGQEKELQQIKDSSGLSAQEHLASIDSLNKQLGSATDDTIKKELNEKIDEAKQNLQKSMSKMSSETLAGFFKATNDVAEKNPLAMTKEEYNVFKTGLAREMVGPKGISSGRFSSFISELQTKGDPTAEAAFIEANAGIKSADINPGIANWLNNNAAKNLGDAKTLYYTGITAEESATEAAEKAAADEKKKAAEAEAAAAESARIRSSLIP